MAKTGAKKSVLEEESKAICVVSVAALRAKPSHVEEQISQLLWGEQIEIIEKKGKNWLKVRCDWDGYLAWVDSKQIHLISSKEFVKNKKNRAFALEIAQGALGQAFGLPILLGSTLPRFDGINFSMPRGKMTYSGQAIFAETSEIDEYRLVKLAMKYIHAPYQWGGRSPFGIDGSGLMQMIFKLGGIPIPRDAEQQIKLGEIVDFPSDARPSDLAFFEDSKGNIVHVGFILEEGKILHAFGNVRIDLFDHHGIFNEDLRKYTHKLRIIKRVKVSASAFENLIEQTESIPS